MDSDMLGARFCLVAFISDVFGRSGKHIIGTYLLMKVSQK